MDVFVSDGALKILKKQNIFPDILKPLNILKNLNNLNNSSDFLRYLKPVCDKQNYYVMKYKDFRLIFVMNKNENSIVLVTILNSHEIF